MPSVLALLRHCSYRRLPGFALFAFAEPHTMEPSASGTLLEHETDKDSVEQAFDLEERARLESGRSIHDRIAQPLAAAHMYLEVLRKDAEKAGYTDEGAYFSEIKQALQESIDSARKLDRSLSLRTNELGSDELIRKCIEPYARGEEGARIRLHVVEQPPQLPLNRKKEIRFFLHTLLESLDRDHPAMGWEMDIELKAEELRLGLQLHCSPIGDPNEIFGSNELDELVKAIGGEFRSRAISQGGEVKEVVVPFIT